MCAASSLGSSVTIHSDIHLPYAHLGKSCRRTCSNADSAQFCTAIFIGCLVALTYGSRSIDSLTLFSSSVKKGLLLLQFTWRRLDQRPSPDLADEIVPEKIGRA